MRSSCKAAGPKGSLHQYSYPQNPTDDIRVALQHFHDCHVEPEQPHLPGSDCNSPDRLPTSFLGLHFCHSKAAKVSFCSTRARNESSCFNKSGSRELRRYLVKLRFQKKSTSFRMIFFSPVFTLKQAHQPTTVFIAWLLLP